METAARRPAAAAARARAPPCSGALLMRDGLLTTEQLEEALAVKEQTGADSARSWSSAAGWTRSRLARALAEQHGLEYVHLGEVQIDQAAVGLLSEQSRAPLRRPAGPLPRRGHDPRRRLRSDRRPHLRRPAPRARARRPDRRRRGGRAREGAAPRLPHGRRDRPRASPPRIRPWTTSVTSRRRARPRSSSSNALVARAIDEGASDLHFEPQSSGVGCAPASTA